jgi:hypothetical protein
VLTNTKIAGLTESTKRQLTQWLDQLSSSTTHLYSIATQIKHIYGTDVFKDQVQEHTTAVQIIGRFSVNGGHPQIQLQPQSSTQQQRWDPLLHPDSDLSFSILWNAIYRFGIIDIIKQAYKIDSPDKQVHNQQQLYRVVQTQ